MQEIDKIEFRVRGRFPRVANIDAEHATFVSQPDGLIERLKKCPRPPDIFTFIQGPPDTEPRFGCPSTWDNLAVLEITTFQDWMDQKIGSAPRKKIRKAQRAGLEIRETLFDEDFIRGMCEIYNESPVRQGRRFEHFGMTPERARGYGGSFPDRSVFIGAYLDAQLIGFIKFVLGLDGTHACTFHVIAMLKHRDKAPTNALMAQAVKSCANRGVRYLIYDHFAYGNKPADGLAEFKVANGFARVDVPRYFVPITPLGVLAIRLGLHLPLNERVPEKLLAPLRGFRERWVRFASRTRSWRK